MGPWLTWEGVVFEAFDDSSLMEKRCSYEEDN